MTMQSRGLDFLRDVDVRLSVELGRTQMKLKDVLALGPESLVVLDRLTDELLDVLVNGKAVAKGEVVSHNGRFGLRIVEMVGMDETAPAQPAVALPGAGDDEA
jgi:flagellar motor switch protein FliN